MDEDDLRDEIDNALAEEEQDSRSAEHDQDDIADDESPEDDTDVEDEGDSEDDSDEEDDSEDRDRSDTKSKRSALADEEDSEDDDDPALDYARPDFTPGSAQVKPFDIRTLKPDPETGLLDPSEVNKAIEEHYAQQGEAGRQAAEQERKTRDLLTQQWTRVSKKYPAVYSNKRLRDLARDMHLNSIGTDQYLTPAQAAARVERTRRELVKTGYKSAKTRRSVEKMTRTERSSGRQSSQSGLSDYEKAKKLAGSRDPEKAALGRRRMMILRRQARQR